MKPERDQPGARRSAAVFLALFSLPALLAAEGRDEASTITPAEILEHVKFLASDALAGREAGTEADVRVEGYLAERFREWGLAPPVPGGSYLQPFEFPRGKRLKLGEGNRLERTGPGGGAYALDREWTPLPFSPRAAVTGALLFAGYGIVWKEKGYDDYAGLDAKGKVVLVLRHTPGEARTDTPWKDKGLVFGPFTYKAARAAEHGAAALIVVNDPNNHPEAGDRLFTLRSARRSERTLIPCLFVTRAVAGGWLKTAGADLSALQTRIDRELAPSSLDLPSVTLSLTTDLVEEDLGPGKTANVVGVVRGRDPLLESEQVVVGAHHDHLGAAGFDPLLGDVPSIHNGADDNASGVAGLLALARAAARSEPPPRRSIVFLAFGAEEQGLLGSRHYLKNPLFPLKKTAAMINLDMIGRSREGYLEAAGVRTSAGFLDDVQRWNGQVGLRVLPRGGFREDSDHASFGERRIPILFFTTGLHGDYHRPTDDWDKINYPDAARVARLAYLAMKDLAERDERPAYQPPFLRERDF